VAVVTVDEGTLECVQLVERWLFELGLMPQLALCADGPALPALPHADAPTWILLQGAAISTIDEDLHRVLAAVAARPMKTRADAAATLAPARVPAARADALVQALIDEGLLAEGH
jgi:hypothetical protein